MCVCGANCLSPSVLPLQRCVSLREHCDGQEESLLHVYSVDPWAYNYNHRHTPLLRSTVAKLPSPHHPSLLPSSPLLPLNYHNSPPIPRFLPLPLYFPLSLAFSLFPSISPYRSLSPSSPSISPFSLFPSILLLSLPFSLTMSLSSHVVQQAAHHSTGRCQTAVTGE